ncbi:MAG: hypothetical protein M3Q36_01350 [bacterium]|nr:hypothetical protein [bacterium]
MYTPTLGIIDDRIALFSEQYAQTREFFDKRGVPFYSIGSVAASAYLDAALDLHRLSPDPAMQVPDFDLVVPRSDLPLAREYREKLAHSSFPVRVGLAIPSQAVDWQPDRDVSLLTSGSKVVPVQSDVLTPVNESSRYGMVRTVDPQVLLEHYGIVMGRIRQKDKPVMQGLREIVEARGSDIDTESLEPFAAHRKNQLRNISQRAIFLTKQVHDMLPQNQREKLKPVIRSVANTWKLR